MRRILTLASVFAALFVCLGCSSSGGRVYTFQRHQAGNVTASDGIGASLFQQPNVQTAFVPGE
ncbi:MAG TPA: hypothetical protein VD997_15630 [Phycisphaerales bacterium]|nr:hypothetical protein [Phycisphaerales bacterium]